MAVSSFKAFTERSREAACAAFGLVGEHAKNEGISVAVEWKEEYLLCKK
jgi:hypothetical protein